MEACWQGIRAKVRQVKFNADPHGFIILTPAENSNECYGIEDYSFNKNYEGLVNYLQSKEAPVFVIHDYLYARQCILT